LSNKLLRKVWLGTAIGKTKRWRCHVQIFYIPVALTCLVLVFEIGCYTCRPDLNLKEAPKTRNHSSLSRWESKQPWKQYSQTVYRTAFVISCTGTPFSSANVSALSSPLRFLFFLFSFLVFSTLSLTVPKIKIKIRHFIWNLNVVSH
jgi:hypothetical protein